MIFHDVLWPVETVFQGENHVKTHPNLGLDNLGMEFLVVLASYV